MKLKVFDMLPDVYRYKTQNHKPWTLEPDICIELLGGSTCYRLDFGEVINKLRIHPLKEKKNINNLANKPGVKQCLSWGNARWQQRAK